MPARPSTIPSSVCPSGTPGPGADSTFCFVPNPNLRPEVGKNKEIGFNVRKNDLFMAGDSFRGKFNVFRNDVTDFIDQVSFGPPLSVPTGPPPLRASPSCPFLQYQNIAQARIQGVEAETMYDANSWFVGVAGTYQDGKNVRTGVGLYSIPPQKVTTTAGVRLFENRLMLSAMWTSAMANKSIPVTYLAGNVLRSRQPVSRIQADAGSDAQSLGREVLNQYYRPYAIPVGSPGDTQNDVKWASAGAGIVFKGGLRYHFGGS